MTENELAVLRVIEHDGPIGYGPLSSHRAIRCMEGAADPDQCLDPVLERLAHRGWIEARDGWRSTPAGRQALLAEMRPRRQAAWEDAR